MNGPDFFILTGFLGSGKTTLLRDFLASPDAADTAVIVNEVGEIGLDGAILREGPGGDVAMAMLSNGCVCCALQSDLARTVEMLLHAERPGAGPLRRIVLETSGLSKPGPILRQLNELAPYRMRAALVATYDAERGPASGGFAEAAAQWAAADVMVVTKADRVSAARLTAAAIEATAINPLARIVSDKDRSRLIGQLFEPSVGTFGTLPVMANPSSGHPSISVSLARLPIAVTYDELAAWLDNLAGLAGDRLLRVKGVIRVAESARPLLVQSVGTTFAAPRQFERPGADSFLVVIGIDLTRAELLSVMPDIGLTIAPASVGVRARPPKMLVSHGTA